MAQRKGSGGASVKREPDYRKHLVAWRMLQPLETLLHHLRQPEARGSRTNAHGNRTVKAVGDRPLRRV